MIAALDAHQAHDRTPPTLAGEPSNPRPIGFHMSSKLGSMIRQNGQLCMIPFLLELIILFLHPVHVGLPLFQCTLQVVVYLMQALVLSLQPAGLTGEHRKKGLDIYGLSHDVPPVREELALPACKQFLPDALAIHPA